MPESVEEPADKITPDTDACADTTETSESADKAVSSTDLPGHTEIERPSAENAEDYRGDDETGFDPTLSLPPELAKKVNADILTSVPYIDNYYNQTYCYLVPRDPKSLYAIWEVGQSTRDYLKEQFGADFFNHNRLILRISQVTGIEFSGKNALSFFEIDDRLDDKVEYWLNVQPDNDYIAEIGYRAKGTEFFEVVARSNTARAPKGYPTGHEPHRNWTKIEVDPNTFVVPVKPEDWRFNQYHYWKERTHAAPEEKGYWSLVLHQHLPFVRHPEYRVSLEEQWFFEAVVSVYTQLINMFWRLERDKIDFRLTVSLTPSLLAMMQDPMLKKRASAHIDQCIALATRERDNSHGAPYHDTVEHILHKFWVAKEVFDAYEGDLTRGYRDFQNLGKLEVITCPATHMLLPLYLHQPEAIRAELATACKQYERTFGRAPRGIWLPEHAFTPGLDKFLAEFGIKWFLVNANGMTEGDTRSQYGTNAPVITPNGVACFGIDQETRNTVWSRDGGYPGHPNYKEWYRDLGYESDWDYLPEYFKTANVRRNTGLKYYRITSKTSELGDKDYYKPLWAEGTVHEQAGQFVYYRGAQANHVNHTSGTKPHVLSAYDAELFGHWWEEGPLWLESVFRKLCCDQVEVRPVTPSEYLAEKPDHQKLMPGASSWGKKDYFQTWVDGREYQPNCWVYRHFFRLQDKMAELATKHLECEDELVIRALNQAGRSLLLAVASDWGFLMETGQAVRYSEIQIVSHIARTKALLEQIEKGKIDENYLCTLESADTIFPYEDMDYKVFARA
jgi:1,4-alpha-glucan branching enzyme